MHPDSSPIYEALRCGPSLIIHCRGSMNGKGRKGTSMKPILRLTKAFKIIRSPSIAPSAIHKRCGALKHLTLLVDEWRKQPQAET